MQTSVPLYPGGNDVANVIGAAMKASVAMAVPNISSRASRMEVFFPAGNISIEKPKDIGMNLGFMSWEGLMNLASVYYHNKGHP